MAGEKYVQLYFFIAYLHFKFLQIIEIVAKDEDSFLNLDLASTLVLSRRVMRCAKGKF